MATTTQDLRTELGRRRGIVNELVTSQERRLREGIETGKPRIESERDKFLKEGVTDPLADIGQSLGIDFSSAGKAAVGGISKRLGEKEELRNAQKIREIQVRSQKEMFDLEFDRGLLATGDFRKALIFATQRVAFRVARGSAFGAVVKAGERDLEFEELRGKFESEGARLPEEFRGSGESEAAIKSVTGITTALLTAFLLSPKKDKEDKIEPQRDTALSFGQGGVRGGLDTLPNQNTFSRAKFGLTNKGNVPKSFSKQ